MKTARYNGWANYETWNVALWLGNDEAIYRAMVGFSAGSRVIAKQAEFFVKEIMPNGTPDFDGNASRYGKVRWGEIASMMNDCR